MAVTKTSITSSFGSVLTSKLRTWLEQNPVEQANQGNQLLDAFYRQNKKMNAATNRYDLPACFVEDAKGDFYDGADVTSTAGSDDVTIATYSHHFLTEPVKLLRSEMKRTAQGIFDLLVHKTKQARLRARNKLAAALGAASQTNSKYPLGLPQIIAEDGGAADTIGGISASSNSGWLNQFKDASDTFANSLSDFDEVSYECTKSGLTDWSFIATTPKVLYGMKAAARAIDQIDIGVKPASGRFADMGWNGVTFEGKPVIVDRHLPVDAGGDSAFFVNDSTYLTVDPSDDFMIEGPFDLQPGGQHGKLWNVYWGGALVTEERGSNGVVFDVTG